MAVRANIPLAFQKYYNPTSIEQEEEDEKQRLYDGHADLIPTLPFSNGYYQYQGFWFRHTVLPGVMACQAHFMARPTDILLSSNPRSGTMWLKALMFSTLSRHANPDPSSPDHPLRTFNPHSCVPFLEFLYSLNRFPDIDSLPSPRLLATHMPYSTLPESVRESGCKIVHVARSPKANLVSQWLFYEHVRLPGEDPLPLDKAVELYVSGLSMYGPAVDHVVGYYEESLRRPEKVLFLKYADVKEDPVGNLRRLAVFMGCPFSEDEERQGVPEGIASLCSFQNLRRQEVNRTGVYDDGKSSFCNRAHFRKADDRDWMNHLTPEMAARVDAMVEQKLSGSSLKL